MVRSNARFFKVRRPVEKGSKTSFYTESQTCSVPLPRRAIVNYIVSYPLVSLKAIARKSRRFVAGL